MEKSRNANGVQRPTSVWARDADLEERARLLREKGGGSKGWGLVLMAYSTLGIVYGDIGTSPLYVYSSIYPSGAPKGDENRLLGTFSMIFWTITVVVTVKYVLLMLRADDNGEGGIIALYSLIKRAAGIHTVTSAHATDLAISSYASGSARKEGHTHRVAAWWRASLKGSRAQQAVLLSVVLLATNMIISDGVLTPAISVVSAVQGIQYNAHISDGAVVGITCAILVLLFGIQGFGTSKVSFLFSPVLLLWFLANAAIGLYNIIHFTPSVWKALSPHYIYYYWQGESYQAWVNLGAVMLCITGAEALYADLGHFNARSIQLSFLTVVYPSIAITYLGQTAFLLQRPAEAANTYWAAIPRPVYWPMVVLATLAAIIASQALITGSFSIVQQGMAMSCFPRFTVRHTSARHSGQVYIPEINYSLLVACLIIVIAFQNATNIGNAYGLAIVIVMCLDTSLLTLVMLLAWEWHWLIVLAFWLLYTFISGAYLSSNIKKVPHGAWFSLMLAGILSIVTFVYHYGQSKKAQYVESHAVPLADLFEAAPSGSDDKQFDAAWLKLQRHNSVQSTVTGTSDGAQPEEQAGPVSLHPGLQQLWLAGTKLPVARVPGVGIYYSEVLSGVPPVLVRFLSLAPVIHEVVVFLTIRNIPVPTVFPEERLLIRKMRGFEGFYHVVARYGYMDHKGEQGAPFVKVVMEEIVEYIQSEDGLAGEAASAACEGGDTDGALDLEAGGGGGEGFGGALPPLPLGAGHVAVEIDPTTSLSSAAGQKMLREIGARLRGRSATDTVTSAGSVGSRGMVAVTMPLEGTSQADDADAHPWIQQPSVLRRVRLTAHQQRALSSGASDGTCTVPAFAAFPRPRLASLLEGPASAKQADSTVSVPLPPPPPRPRIYRVNAADGAVVPGGPSGISSAVEIGGPEGSAGLRNRRSPYLPSVTSGAPLSGQDSPTATLSYQAAARLRTQLQAVQLEGVDGAHAEQGAVEREQELVMAAYRHGAVYLVGSSMLRAKDTGRMRWLKAPILNGVYATLVANTRPAAAAYNLPTESLLQVGVVYEV